jgi:hypothetical protein
MFFGQRQSTRWNIISLHPFHLLLTLNLPLLLPFHRLCRHSSCLLLINFLSLLHLTLIYFLILLLTLTVYPLSTFTADLLKFNESDGSAVLSYALMAKSRLPFRLALAVTKVLYFFRRKKSIFIYGTLGVA